MSIYIYTKDLEKLTNGVFKAPPLPKIDTNNDKINQYYWDYKINTKAQLEDNIDLGYLLTNILMHEILVNMYLLNDKKFEKLLLEINMDRNIMSKLLISYNYKLVNTYNYFLLIKRIFNSNNITDLLFPKNKKINFTCEQLTFILSDMGFNGINNVYYKISSNKKLSIEEKLKHIKCLLEINNDLIDQETTIYYSIKKPKLFLGFYLFNLDLDEKLNNLFYEVLKLFFLNNGVREIIVVDNFELNEKMKSKYLLFKDLV